MLSMPDSYGLLWSGHCQSQLDCDSDEMLHTLSHKCLSLADFCTDLVLNSVLPDCQSILGPVLRYWCVAVPLVSLSMQHNCLSGNRVWYDTTHKTVCQVVVSIGCRFLSPLMAVLNLLVTARLVAQWFLNLAGSYLTQLALPIQGNQALITAASPLACRSLSPRNTMGRTKLL